MRQLPKNGWQCNATEGSNFNRIEAGYVSTQIFH